MWPPAFEASIRELLGKEADAFFLAMQAEPTVSVRLHPQKGAGLFADSQQLLWSRLGRKLPARPSFTLDPLFHTGAYYVQDASSQFLEEALRQSVAIENPLVILDACAAPGGKTTHLLALAAPGSTVIANEVIGSRARILQENLFKWGMPGMLLTNADPAKLAKAALQADVIVVDAPCSGEGLFRKNTEAVQEWSPAHVDHCAARQRRILGDVWPLLKPGGVLLYSTCTWNEQENDDVLLWMTEKFGADSVQLHLPDWPVHIREKAGVYTYRFFPQDDAGEGFCCGVLRKAAGEPAPFRKIPVLKEALERRPLLAEAVSTPAAFLPVALKDTIFALPKTSERILAALLAEKIPVLAAGVPLGEMFGARKEIKLHPMLTHSTVFASAHYPSVSLEKEDALTFLRRGDIQMLDAGNRVVVTHEGRNLGWGRLKNGRLTSQYPMEYRIRK